MTVTDDPTSGQWFVETCDPAVYVLPPTENDAIGEHICSPSLSTRISWSTTVPVTVDSSPCVPLSLAIHVAARSPTSRKTSPKTSSPTGPVVVPLRLRSSYRSGSEPPENGPMLQETDVRSRSSPWDATVPPKVGRP